MIKIIITAGIKFIRRTKKIYLKIIKIKYKIKKNKKRRF